MNNNIDNPSIYKDNWLKFDKTVLYPLEYNDCNDTIEGVCYNNLSLDDCIKKCENSNDCDALYNIKIDDTNICVPIRTSIINDVNPSYRLKNQNIYNFDNNVDITFLQNKEKYPYPVYKSRQILYNNLLSLSLYYKKDYSLTFDKSDVFMDTKKITNMVILPNKSRNNTFTKFKTVKYGDLLSFHIPNTTLVLTRKYDNKLHFEIKTTDNISVENTELKSNITYILEPIDKNKKNDIINWFEPFIIKTIGNGICTINKKNELLILDESIERFNKEKIYFMFVPQFTGYYCEKDECVIGDTNNTFVEENSDNLKIKNLNGETKDFFIKENCWNTCKKYNQTPNNQTPNNQTPNNKTPNNQKLNNQKLNTNEKTNNINFIKYYIIIIYIIIIIIILIILLKTIKNLYLHHFFLNLIK